MLCSLAQPTQHIRIADQEGHQQNPQLTTHYSQYNLFCVFVSIKKKICTNFDVFAHELAFMAHVITNYRANNMLEIVKTTAFKDLNMFNWYEG
jgi:nitroreductase